MASYTADVWLKSPDMVINKMVTFLRVLKRHVVWTVCLYGQLKNGQMKKRILLYVEG